MKSQANLNQNATPGRGVTARRRSPVRPDASMDAGPEPLGAKARVTCHRVNRLGGFLGALGPCHRVSRLGGLLGADQPTRPRTQRRPRPIAPSKSPSGLTRWHAGCVALFLAAPSASAEVFTSSGLTFVAVRDAGNRGATATEAPLWPTWAPPLGAVDHEFGIMRTNVTNGEWIEFVRSYGQHWTGSPGAFALTGPEIFYTGTVGGVRQYEVGTGAGRHSAQASWRVMARYCNWLHNGKVNEAWAFENGAYDTSTFGEVTIGGITQLTDQFTHHPDARHWIPTVNEYTKGAHWDQDKFGPGQGGYWLMPDGGDERLVAGPPGVGEAAGDWIAFPYLLDVESYPGTQSPWGMLDVSSTVHQFTEGLMHPSAGVYRFDRGSQAGSAVYWNHDRIDYWGGMPSGTIPNSIRGIRIATAIPSPASVVVLVVGVSVMNRRFRHGNDPGSIGRSASGGVRGE